MMGPGSLAGWLVVKEGDNSTVMAMEAAEGTQLERFRTRPRTRPNLRRLYCSPQLSLTALAG